MVPTPSAPVPAPNNLRDQTDGNDTKGTNGHQTSLNNDSMVKDRHCTDHGADAGEQAMVDTDRLGIVSAGSVDNTSSSGLKVNATNNTITLVASLEKSVAPKSTSDANAPPVTDPQPHVEGNSLTRCSVLDTATTDSKNEGVPANALCTDSLQGEQSETVRQPAGEVIDERQQRILDNIKHRRMLLSWVRESRLASEKLIGSISRGDDKNFITAILEDGGANDLKGISSSSDGGTAKFEASTEIDNFRKIASMASSSSFLKKLKSGGPSVESAAVRDMRKGINIGKRMSAAVSTLNNTGGWASSDSSASQVAGLIQPPHPSNASSGAMPPKNITSATPTPTMQPLPTKSLSPVPPTDHSQGGSQINPPPLKTQTLPNSVASSLDQKATLEKPQKKTKKRSSSIKKMGLGGNDVSASLASISMQHNGVSNGGANINSAHFATQSTVLSVDAAKMIEMRDALTTKLNNLLRKRQLEALRSGTQACAKRPKIKEFQLHSKSKGANIAFTQYNQVKKNSAQIGNLACSSGSIPYKFGSFSESHQLKEPQRLPPRRKTHWDFVMEEMRWLATDFIEERKWKVACGKTLSTAVENHCNETKSAKKKKTAAGPSNLKSVNPSKSRDHMVTDSNSSTDAPVVEETLEKRNAESNDTSPPNQIRICMEGTDPIYVDASKDDIDNARNVAKLLSITVTEHWDTTLGEGVFPANDDSYAMGYERFKTLRGDTSNPDNSDSSSESSYCTESSAAMELENTSPDCESSGGEYTTPSSVKECPEFQELDFDEILQEMQASVGLLKSLKEQTVNVLEKERALQKYWNTLKCGVELNRAQINTVHFVENLWQTDCNSFGGGFSNERRSPDASVSAILGGLAVGKTVAVCSLLWKNRHVGPQLVLCSPSALFRWKHELTRFDGLDVKIVGRNGWSFSGEDESHISYEASDVVVCDYESFLDLASHYSNLNESSEYGSDRFAGAMNFASLILDLRHSPPGNIQRSQKPERNMSTVQLKHNSTLASSLMEIESLKWWNSLNKFILRMSDMKRLIIDHSNLLHNRCSPANSSGASKGSHIDEVLAMKVAFIFHPSIFFSEHASIGKRIISWAKRQQVSAYQNVALVQKECFLNPPFYSGTNIPPPLLRRSVLSSSLSSMSEFVADLSKMKKQPPNEDIHQVEDRLNHLWELRMCNLSKIQLIAYRQCCYHVRGPLSQSHKSVNEHIEIEPERSFDRSHVVSIYKQAHRGFATAILKLRRVCIHSNLDEFISSVVSPLRHKMNKDKIRGRSGSSILNNNTTHSEPDIEAATIVAERSSKMRELFLVLTEECGYNVPVEYELKENLNMKSKGKTSPKRKARVLILATLIEAQLLTSFFLSAIGLHHELLVSGFKHTEGRGNSNSNALPSSENAFISHIKSDVDSVLNMANATAWAWSQSVLSSFNNEDSTEEKYNFRHCGIIIASPTTISSQNGGISAASADVVISIDEDWSGREALHITSILTKIRCREQGVATSTKSSPCKFIKLVCQNTCEDTFLCKGLSKEPTDAEMVATKPEGKRETRKRTRMGTRRSPRGDHQSTDAIKTDHDETAADCSNNTISTSKPKLYCPINMQLENLQVNSNGFLAPFILGCGMPGLNIPSAQTDSLNTKHSFIGSHISRYRCSKLSEVLCTQCQGPYQDLLFLPKQEIDGRMSSIFSDDNFPTMFAWALINAEEDASYYSTLNSPFSRIESDVNEVDFELRNIAFVPSPMPFSVDLSNSILARHDVCSASIRYYIKSVGHKSSSIASGASKVLHLVDRTDTLSTQEVDNLNCDSTNNGDACLLKIKHENKPILDPNPNDGAFSLLLYTIPCTTESGLCGKHTPGGLIRSSLQMSHPMQNGFPNISTFDASLFSCCFTSSNNTQSVIVQDGNQGCEPLMYFPSFLPALRQIIQNVVYSSNNFSVNGMKRNNHDELSRADNKRLKLSNQLDETTQVNSEQCLPLNTLQQPPIQSLSVFEDQSPNCFFATPNSYPREAQPELLIDFFLNEIMETNTCSFERGRSNQGNSESVFSKKLLSFDVRGALSFQLPPALSSMIMVTQEKEKTRENTVTGASRESVPPKSSSSTIPVVSYPNPCQKTEFGPLSLKSDSSQKMPRNLGKKSSSKKKTKKHHQHSKPYTIRDKLIRPYFKNSVLLARSFSVREGVQFESATSLIGLVRFRFRLNDLVSKSFVKLESSAVPARQQRPLTTQSPMVWDVNLQPSSLPLPMRIHIGQFPVGSMPTFNQVEPQRKQTSYRAIELPMGVRTPRFAKQLSSSLEETSEPWTDIEDSLLKESFSRYGKNWQLAAHAVSAAGLPIQSFAEQNNYSKNKYTHQSRRSPAQCRDRWESLKSTEESLDNMIRLHEDVTTSKTDTQSNNTNEIILPTNEEIPWFQNAPGDKEEECLIYHGSSSLNQSAHSESSNTKGKNTPIVSASILSTSNEYIVSRIRQIGEISKKRRVIPITIPGSNSGANDMTVRLVPIHPSHAESVQTARNNLAASSNGVAPPPEMWPLTLLDFADKQRAASSGAATKNNSAAPSTGTIQLSLTTQPPHPPPHPPLPPHLPIQPNATSYQPQYSGHQNAKYIPHK